MLVKPSDVKPITYMKTHAAELVAGVNENRNPVLITQSGKPRAVVMDVRSYERIQDALVLLKLISQSEEDIRKGRWVSQAEMETDLSKRLSAK